MILMPSKLAEADYSERSLVAKTLCAHVFNRSARCNIPTAQAFREFVRLATGFNVPPERVGDCWATVEFRVARAVRRSDNTELDAIAAIAPEVLCVIECKYCDPFRIEGDQIGRVCEATLQLATEEKFHDCVVLLIAPEMEFASIAADPQREDVRTQIRNRMVSGPPRLRCLSWEAVFELVAAASPSEKGAFEQYLAVRNRNRNYPIRLSMTPKVRAPEDWQSILVGNSQLPSELHVPRNWPPRQREPVSTQGPASIMATAPAWQQEAYHYIMETAGIEAAGNVKPLGRLKGRYVNIQRSSGVGQNDLLVYPTERGLALIFDKQKSDVTAVPFEEWEYCGKFMSIHRWFKDRRQHLRVWVVDGTTWASPDGKEAVRKFVVELIRNRGKRR